MTGGGRVLVNHTGARLLSDVADDLGLTLGLSVAMTPTEKRRRGHDRGDVGRDLAVMIADGGRFISDLAVLRDQPRLFEDVASNSTAWRTLEAIDDQVLERIAAARAHARENAWLRGMDPGFYVIDIDVTLVTAHSNKEQAAPNYKHTFGHYPLVAYLDATGEALAGLFRPGNAGSGTAADHIQVLDDALFQLPSTPAHSEVIVRVDTAGCSHAFLDTCVERDVRFIVGHQLTAPIAQLLVETPDEAWQNAISADGTEERDWAQVVELTDRIDLSDWPEGARMTARREHAHPGAQLTFTDLTGHRFQVCLTNLPDDDIAYLEALYRGRGRVERHICDAKDTGLENLPSGSFAINQAWLTSVLIAQDLLAWTQHLLLDGDLATAEPKRLRYCLLHVAALVATGSRRPNSGSPTTGLGPNAHHRIHPAPTPTAALLSP